MERIAELSEEKTQHSHAKNYGRIVVGCPRCMEIVVERGSATTSNTAVSVETVEVSDASVAPGVFVMPPTSATVTAAPIVPQVVPPPPAPSGVMTMEQVMLMIQALREPDDETKRKRQEERLLQARREAEALQLAKDEMEQKAFRHSHCGTGHGPHTKDNGRSAIQGQIHSDGMFHGICVRCGYQPTPVQPAVGTIVGGIQ